MNVFYPNILLSRLKFGLYSANRKKAEARKKGRGPPQPPLTEEEELALSHNTWKLVAEGIPGGSSSEPITRQDISGHLRCKCKCAYVCIHVYTAYMLCIYLYIPLQGFSFLPTVTDGVICLVEPPPTTELLAVVSTQYSRDFAKYSSLKYTETVCYSSSKDDDTDTLFAATERDPEKPTEVYNES